jgi:hypothetical protein
MKDLQQAEYEALLAAARIQSSEVAELHLAWGLRDPRGSWQGVLLVELTRGRGCRGGKRGDHRFALIESDSFGASVSWNRHLDQGWHRTLSIEGDHVVAAPEPPPPPARAGGRRAAVAATKQKYLAMGTDDPSGSAVSRNGGREDGQETRN